MIAALDDVDAAAMRQVATTVQQKLGGDGIVVLGSAPGGNAVVIVWPAKQHRLLASMPVSWSLLAKQLGGGGGGRPDQAQAGGRNGNALPTALDSAPKLIAEAMG